MANQTRTYSVKFLLEGAQAVKAELKDFGSTGKKALNEVSESAKKLSEGFGAVGGIIGKLGPIAKIAGTTAAVFGALKTTVYALTKASLDYAGSLNDMALTANISVESLQELTYAGTRAGLSMETIASGIAKLNAVADEFVTSGGGSAADAFDRLGLSQEEVNKGLENSEELFTTVIDRLRQTGDTAAQVNLAQKIFGKEDGKEFVRLVNESAGEIQNMRREARELGIVLSSDVIEAADQTGDKIEALSAVIQMRLKNAFIENSDVIYEFVDGVSRNLPKAIQILNELAVALGLIEENKLENLRNVTAELQAANAELERYNSLSAVAKDPVDAYRAYNKKMGLQVEKGELETELGLFGKGYKVGTQKYGPFQPEAPTTAADAAIERQLQRRVNSSKSSGRSTRDEADAIREKIAALSEEIKISAQSEREQAALRAERTLGTKATTAQKLEVRQLAYQLYDQNVALDAAKEAMDRYDSAVDTIGNSLNSLSKDALAGNLRSWEDWGNRILDIASEIAEQMWILQGFQGSGGFANSIASGILGMFGYQAPTAVSGAANRAAGGPVAAGISYRFRETGEEYLVPTMDAQVVPAAKMGGGSFNVNIINNTSSEVSVQEDRSGSEPSLMVMIDKAVAGKINQPGSNIRAALKTFTSDGAIRR